MPNALLTPTDFAIYNGGGSLDSDQVRLLEQLIPAGQDALEVWLGRPITVRRFTEKHILEPDQTRVYFRKTPVAAVESAKIVAGTTTSPYDYTLTESTEYLVNTWGLDYTLLTPGALGARMDVIYWGGLNGAEETAASPLVYDPGDYHPGFRLILLEACNRVLLRPKEITKGVQGFSTDGGYSVKFGAHIAGALTATGFGEEDLAPFKRLKRRSIGSGL